VKRDFGCGGETLTSPDLQDYLTFDSFFYLATGNKPYPFQKRFAESDRLPDLIDIPTGMGKTDAVILGWIWRRRFDPRPQVRSSTPRRLVYCLPMRVLVEQTVEKSKGWLKNLGLLGTQSHGEPSIEGHASRKEDDADKISVTVLMGGAEKDKWDYFPQRDTILIGTVDMLLSRALNRGYAMSRYRWPVHFGLLNNDCLWIMDEVQLMGVSCETSAQLQGFCDSMKTIGPVHHIWMSATLDEGQIGTIDHPKPEGGWSKLMLDSSERSLPQVSKRIEARKQLRISSLRLTKEGEKGSYARDLAKLLIDKHKSGTLTLAVVNRVQRSQMVFEELLKLGRTPEDSAVLHSRFREGDRSERMKLLEGKKDGLEGIQDRIVIATQVVEAGVDISACTLVTELAPWPSLVQRFGRCNRRGENAQAEIELIDIDINDKDGGLVLPYDLGSLKVARALASKVEDAGPSSLSLVGEEYVEPKVIRSVIRKRDILDLFDTTSDLTGNDLDVSRYIREEEEKDVHVYWRNVPETGPGSSNLSPSREELCSVSISDINKYFKKFAGWSWDFYEGRWRTIGYDGEIKGVRPGQLIMLRAEYGGYSEIFGWSGTSGREGGRVSVIPSEADSDTEKESMDYDGEAYIGSWITLQQHINDVIREAGALTKRLPLSEKEAESIIKAAKWHDVGKLHEAFQNMLAYGQNGEVSPSHEGPWAKSDNPKVRGMYWIMSDGGIKNRRPGFRHELASALAWLSTEGKDKDDADLVAFLVAGHHGKIRLSIRSLPMENEPPDGRLFARGLWQGDQLKPFPDILLQMVSIDLSLMQMGEGSWLERMLRLRDDPEVGPFRLAFLESILRIADWRASEKEALGDEI
jgi:CRISPR-associated endonuclease/helicase Cas3